MVDGLDIHSIFYTEPYDVMVVVGWILVSQSAAIYVCLQVDLQSDVYFIESSNYRALSGNFITGYAFIQLASKPIHHDFFSTSVLTILN